MVGKFLKSNISLIFLIALPSSLGTISFHLVLNETAILTGILVIVTAWYAYSTYKLAKLTKDQASMIERQAELMAKQTEHMLKERERLLLIRTIERHSDDLKALAKIWLNEIPSIDDPSKMMIHEPTQPFESMVGKEYLFSDIKEHVPSRLDLFPTWENFKSKFYEYNKKRNSLFKKIQEDIEARTELPYDPNFDLHSISEHFIEVVYEDAFQLARDKKQRWLYEMPKVKEVDKGFLLTVAAHGLAYGTRSECEKADKVLGDLLSGLKESEYLVLAKALLEDKKKLDDLRNDLILKVNDFISIPILPNTECKYIKLSKEIK